MTTKEEILIPARYARATRLKAGDLLSLVAIDGPQVGDFIAFKADDFSEFMSTGHTRAIIGHINLQLGDKLMSNNRRALFEIVHDDVGVHDILISACDHYRYSVDFGLDDHRNCRDNLREALAEYNLPPNWTPDPVNVFMNTPALPDGNIRWLVSPAKKGDRFTVRALQDLVVAVSACPQDIAPINGQDPKDLLMIVEHQQEA